MADRERDNDTRLERGSGNVFEDLGFSDASERLAKAELAARVVEILEKRDLTQAASGKLLSIPQSNVSDLMNGKLRRFSTDRLIQFLLALGRDVEIQITTPRRRQGEFRISGPGKRTRRLSPVAKKVRKQA